jgi:hypothetical protein
MSHLVGRRGYDVGAGFEVVKMDLADEVRGGDEAPGAPELVLQVRAVRLQLRAHGAVHHQAPPPPPPPPPQRVRRVVDERILTPHG